MSGISAHTLRMWERRYGFPVPQRTPGGARRYTEEDVGTLKLIAQALEAGYRAGDVVSQPRATIAAMVLEQLPAQVSGEPPHIDRVIPAIVRDDVVQVREHLRQAVATLGPKRFLVDFAQPLAVKIGELWQSGAIAIRQEHATSDLLITQIRALLAGFEGGDGRPRVLLATLPGELHGLPLEMVALYLALHQATPRSLGVATPVQEIADAAMALEVDVVGLSVSPAAVVTEVTEEVKALLGELPRRVELWIGGEGATALDLEDVEAKRLVTWDDIDDAIQRWRELASK